MKIRVFSFLLAIVFAMSVFPAMAAATSGKCGDNIIWTFIDGTLTLDGTGATYNYSSDNRPPWFEHGGSIRKVVIAEGITAIGDYGFAGCVQVTGALLPSTLVSIGKKSFSNWINLVEMEIPEGVTSIGDGAFEWNDRFEKIVVNGSGAQLGANVFNGCSALTVYGAEGSTVQSYASANGVPFVSIGGETSIGDKIILTIGQMDAMVFGKVQTNDVAPIIRNDRTMLPARFVAEELGADVSWYAPEQLVIITKGDTKIMLAIDSTVATVNGETVGLDSPAFIENGRTYTPVRFIVEALGATVAWNGEAQQVIITK